MPYENSRRNLEATYEQNVRSRVLVPIFAYPALFRMRFELPDDYDFSYFTDKEQKAFMLNSTPDGSFVLPADPYSIVDKLKHLKAAGFNKVLIDFSKVKVTRNQIKAIMSSMNKGQPLPNVSRFNWKDGFYSPQQMEEYKAANERALQRKQSGKGSAAQGRFKNKSSRRRK
jgi:putative protease